MAANVCRLAVGDTSHYHAAWRLSLSLPLSPSAMSMGGRFLCNQPSTVGRLEICLLLARRPSGFTCSLDAASVVVMRGCPPVRQPSTCQPLHLGRRCRCRTVDVDGRRPAWQVVRPELDAVRRERKTQTDVRRTFAAASL